MITHDYSTHAHIVVLLAHGFDEESSRYCLKRFQTANLSVVIVGVSAETMIGRCGAHKQPDVTLNAYTPLVPNVIFLPDGEKHAAILLSDPRVRRLIERTVAHGGHVVALPAAEMLLWESKMITSANLPHFLLREGYSLEEFMDCAVHYLSKDHIKLYDDAPLRSKRFAR